MPSRPLSLLSPSLRVTQARDGTIYEAIAEPAAPVAKIGDWLARWATERPDTTFLAERFDGAWRRITYASALRSVAGIAGRLAALGASQRHGVMVLSDNSIAHALVALAAMHAGSFVVPVSPAYSLSSSTFGRLGTIAARIEPAVVFVETRGPFERALDVIGAPHVIDADDVARASSAEPLVARDGAIAKILFTSGSTGEPKGVINTHAMLTSNQEGLFAAWPFLADEPPVIVDWLPWSHTFGGNHDFHLVLRNGGTLYVDRGRPAPGLLDTTLENLADVGPNLWFNVPRGYDQAVDALEKRPELARAAFRNLRLAFYAAASLSQSTRSRLEALGASAGNPELFLTSAWGSTETSPLATSAHYPTPRAGVLGVPIPGVRIKLARVEDRLELRVQGPSVTPGYWQHGGTIEPVALDVDGFLPTGDAGCLVDEAHPEAGFRFVGRLSENFKLSSGTWVSVGPLRLALIDACAPMLADVIVAGHDRESLGALLVVAPAYANERARLESALRDYDRAHPASSEHIARALVLARPPSLDDGEITDKGTINQRRVLERRAADVARLFATPAADDVIVLDR